MTHYESGAETRAQRIAKARAMLSDYAEPDLDLSRWRDMYSAISDTIADLLHVAVDSGLTTTSVLDLAQDHLHEESAGAGVILP